MFSVLTNQSTVFVVIFLFLGLYIQISKYMRSLKVKQIFFNINIFNLSFFISYLSEILFFFYYLYLFCISVSTWISVYLAVSLYPSTFISVSLYRGIYSYPILIFFPLPWFFCWFFPLFFWKFFSQLKQTFNTFPVKRGRW